MTIKKTFLLIFIVICLVVGWSSGTMAANRFFIDYSKDEGEPEIGPKIGFDWDLSKTWLLTAGYEFDGEGDNESMTFLGLTKSINDFSFGFKIQDSDSETVYRGFLGKNYKVNDALRTKWRISYLDYLQRSDADSDYTDLILSGGLRYKFNDRWRTSYDISWNNIDQEFLTETDESKLDQTVRLTYQLNKTTRLTGGLILTGTCDQCYDTNWNGWSTSYLVNVAVEYGKVSFYVEYHSLDDGDELSCALSYYF